MTTKVDEFAELRLDWQVFFKKRYGWDVDFSQVFVPPRPSLLHRLIIVAKGLTCDKAYDAWPFQKWKYDDSLDVAVSKNARTSEGGHYAIWVCDGVEPDAEFLGKSTKVADPEMMVGVTLLERLLLEDKYFDETGKHLDIISATNCSGSRSAVGSVPTVFLGLKDSVLVLWRSHSFSSANKGVRRAVSS